MRFTIAQILLLFPAYCIAFACVPFLGMRPLGTPRFVRAYSDVRMAETNILSARQEHWGSKISDDDIDRWLAGTLSPQELIDLQLYENLDMIDPWGRPYVYIHRDDPENEDPAVVRVYSLGRDGVSKSQGNDPDDINNWDEDCYRYYVDEITLRYRMQYAVTAIPLTFLTYPALLGVIWLVKRVVRDRTRRAAPVSRKSTRSEVE